jgi:uncharacterized low-complexity protein
MDVVIDGSSATSKRDPGLCTESKNAAGLRSRITQCRCAESLCLAERA